MKKGLKMTRGKYLVFSLAMLVLAFVLAACGGTTPGAEVNTEPTPTPTPSPTPTPNPSKLKACEFLTVSELNAITPGAYSPSDSEQTTAGVKMKVCSYGMTSSMKTINLSVIEDTAGTYWAGVKADTKATEVSNLGEGAYASKLGTINYLNVKKGKFVFLIQIVDTMDGSAAENVELAKKIATQVLKKA